MRSHAMDHLFTVSIWSAALLVASAFAWLLGDVAWQGTGHLSWSFLVSEPLNAGRAGGVAPILVSTLLILVVALVAAVPLGLAAAVWLAEYTRRGGARAHGIGLSLDVLAGCRRSSSGCLATRSSACSWDWVSRSSRAG